MTETVQGFAKGDRVEHADSGRLGTVESIAMEPYTRMRTLFVVYDDGGRETWPWNHLAIPLRKVEA